MERKWAKERPQAVYSEKQRLILPIIESTWRPNFKGFRKKGLLSKRSMTTVLCNWKKKNKPDMPTQQEELKNNFNRIIIFMSYHICSSSKSDTHPSIAVQVHMLQELTELSHKWVTLGTNSTFFFSSYKFSNSRKKAWYVEAIVIIFLIQPIFTSEGKMVSGPSRLFLKLMMDQLNKQEVQLPLW